MANKPLKHWTTTVKPRKPMDPEKFRQELRIAVSDLSDYLIDLTRSEK